MSIERECTGYVGAPVIQFGKGQIVESLDERS